MALWKQALAKLRGSADTVPSSENAADIKSGDIGLAEAVAETGKGVDTPSLSGAVDQEALARELRVGIEVSLGDLAPCAAGWRYRGHPVMVFGAEAPELSDAKRRREFFSQAHLFPCCGALQSKERSVWVGTDLEAMNESHGQGPFKPCRECLHATAGRGANSRQFNFPTHVRSHGDSYFAAAPCFWRPGRNALSLQAPAAAAGSCPKCGCASAEAHWQVAAEDAARLHLPIGICLLCAERDVDGCLHMPEQLLLEAASTRYRYLMSQAVKAPSPSWKLAEAILPLGWQPLLRSLQRKLPPPELFFEFSESASPAVLAWPALHRGIVETPGDVQEGKASHWNLWTRGQIEVELGFHLRQKS